MNRFFMYVDPTEYEMTQEGLMKACLAEVIAEAKTLEIIQCTEQKIYFNPQNGRWKIS